MHIPDSPIELVEVSPRDGLQNEQTILSTADKLELIARAVAAGARRIEVASFVHPRLVPQMADAEAVIDGLPQGRGITHIGLVLNASGDVFGYTLGNDMSSRSIEGENPLYLPQAKIYDRSCAIGPAIVPSWAAGPGPFEIGLRVLRDGRPAYAATTSTSAMARGFTDLAGWLFRALSFPTGVVLLTGTGVVPDADRPLHHGEDRGERPRPRRRRGKDEAHPPRLPRSHRPATDARAGR